MPNWKPIEHLPAVLPIGHVLAHELLEAIVVRWFQDMDHLVHDDVFEALRRLAGQVGVQADRPGSVVAASPAGFHAADVEAGDFHADLGLPPRNQLLGSYFDEASVPLFQDFPAFGLIGRGADLHQQPAVPLLHRWGGFDLFNRQQESLAPNVVAFPFQVLAGRFPFLVLHFAALAFDPIEPGDCVEAKRVHAGPLRGCQADAAVWRVNTQMDILDVLQDDIDRNLSQVDRGRHWYSFWFLIIEKTSSTWSTSCKIP